MKNTEHYLYETWKGMRQRCTNTNHKNYHQYGGRGITVCKHWDDFWQFVSDMGERPEAHSLDRIDNSKDYSPDNCRWGSEGIQKNNTRYVENAKGYQKTSNGKFQVKVRVANKQIYLGTYSCPLLAHLAYRDFREDWYAPAD